jgi:arylsulfatase A
MREPTVFWWPGHLKPGVVMELGTTMDLLPTFCSLSGTPLPEDRVYDGYDISPVLLGTGKGEREVVFYYRGEKVYAVRKGNYKAHFITQLEYGSPTAHPITDPPMEVQNTPTVLEEPLLYNVNVDPGEKYNIAGEHPEIIQDIRKVLEEHLATLEEVENQLEKR